MGSATGAAIKAALIEEGYKALRVNPDRTKYRQRRGDLVVYLGGNKTIRGYTGTCLNVNRNIAQNKLTTFQALQEAGVTTVPWTSDRDVASQWTGMVMARHTLTGHSGQGIETYDVEANPFQHFPDAPLYTKYIKKTYECRVHVFGERVIDAQIKRKVRDAEENNALVRNIYTGWVYCREDFILPDAARDIAIAATRAVGLDFGAVDLIYNQHYDQFYVLEVNTCPGLTGQTLTNYTNAIKGFYNEARA